MQEKIIGVRVASFVTLNYYDHLKNMELMGMTDSSEYANVATRLAKKTKVENMLYDEFTAEEIDKYLLELSEREELDKIEARSYLKLKERKKELTGGLMVGEHTLLSSVISSKLYIDILKDVDAKIASLADNEQIDDDDIETLRTYHINYKYHYLSANKFLEQIAIKHNFNISNLPEFSFSEIEEAYNVKFMNSIQNILYDYVTSAIQELVNYDADDKYLLSYISIFEVARVKVMLPYLAEDKLDKVLELFEENKYSYDKNGALRKVKKLIKKRKEEFSE